MATKRNLSFMITSYQIGTFRFQCGICFPSSVYNPPSQQLLIQGGAQRSHQPPVSGRGRDGPKTVHVFLTSPLPFGSLLSYFWFLQLQKRASDWGWWSQRIDQTLLKLDKDRDMHVYTRTHIHTPHTHLPRRHRRFSRRPQASESLPTS